MISYLIFAGLWVLYFIIHSGLATSRVKSFFERILGKHYRFYRIVYSMISIIGLVLLLFISQSFSPVLLFDPNGLTDILGLSLVGIGVIIIYLSFRQYQITSFIGFNEEVSNFTRKGILQHVRHPIYSGTILIVVGYFLFSPILSTLISVACILIYLPVGIYFEETKLIRQYGDLYLSYKKDVPAVFPKLRKELFQKASQN